MASRSRIRCAFPRRGFTLLESLIAAAILLGVVIAVTAAVTAGQHHAYTAHQTIMGTLAAEEMMTRLEKAPYENLDDYEQDESPGTMTDASGASMGESFAAIGRQVRVMQSFHAMAGIGVRVLGRTVTVRTYDGNGTLIVLSRFVPQPASDSLPPEEEDDNLLDDLLNLGGGLLGGLGGLLK